MDLQCPLAAAVVLAAAEKRIYDSNATKHKVWNRGYIRLDLDYSNNDRKMKVIKHIDLA